MGREKNMPQSQNKYTEKGKLKINLICRKAVKVFSRKGYAFATLADVANAAGMSKAGIFHYFSMKEELLFVILNRYMDYTLHELKRKIKSARTPSDKIRTLVYHHIGHYRNNPDESRLILHESGNLPKQYRKILVGKQKEYMGILISAIEDLIEDTEDKYQRAKIIAYSLIGMCNWPYMWFDPNGPVSPETLAKEICDIFFGTLAEVASQTR